MKIIHPLEHPEIYKAYGKKIGGGILMYGPPGCGKTHLARATAGEINANFISVGISDILDMYIGQSERNLHAIFEKARKLKPCVLFFDEVDAPLDDANIEKFNKIIRKFSIDSQFIIVTHNKMTMAAVDVIYGVYMAEPGVSGVSEVDFRDLEETSQLEEIIQN